MEDGRLKEAKVVMLGAEGVGKTCLVLRYVQGTFTQTQPTIGAFFITKKLSVNGHRIRLQLWDTAGQERYRSMTPMYYRGVHVAVLVCDVTRENTFAVLQSWVTELRSNVNNNIVLAVAANKVDLPERKVPHATLRAYAASIGALFFDTSAKDNTGIEEMFLEICVQLLDRERRGLLTLMLSAATPVEAPPPPRRRCCQR
eukprot:gnl/Spiro4/12441_TR6572_c0_g1_i1.p1 gnl/Spiro4/12441_TR6572_c0_g1~~gnl/Spiro4/12441_TR6572_c0_g1_i1.p1  ORF type:complete len:210 (-),score=22.00 gnl/Spiro4/12441_TR6572_c0_g1_i1:201-800(-)